MHNLKHISNIILAVVFLQGLCYPFCFASDRKNDPFSLRGIEKAFIVIDYSNPEIANDPLIEKQIRTDTWEKVRAVSIIVLPNKKLRKFFEALRYPKTHLMFLLKQSLFGL